MYLVCHVDCCDVPVQCTCILLAGTINLDFTSILTYSMFKVHCIRTPYVHMLLCICHSYKAVS